MTFPEKQVYFFYGNEEEALNKARRELVGSLLTREEREDNYLEFAPGVQRKRLKLVSVMPDLLAELGMVSFFPDSRRVVLVYNLDELYKRRKKSGGSGPKSVEKEKKGKKKAKPNAYFIRYLEDQLPETSNILIMINTENYEENLRVAENSTLFKALAKIGHVEKFSSRPLQWEFEDAVRGKRLVPAIQIMRRWIKKDPDSARRIVFHSLVKQVILLMQAKVRSKRKNALALNPELEQLLFERDIRYNLSRERDFLQRKYMQGQKGYTARGLQEALRSLLDINRYVFPQTTDVYVPDIQIIFERFLVELMSGKN